MKLAQHLGKHLAKRLASTLATIGGGGSPALLPETLAYQSRVLAAGGAMTADGLTLVNEIFKNASSQGITLQRGYFMGTACNLNAASRTILEVTGNGQSFVADSAANDSTIHVGLGSLCHDGTTAQQGYFALSSDQLFNNTDWTMLVYMQKPLTNTNDATHTSAVLSQYNSAASGRIVISAGVTGGYTVIPWNGTAVTYSRNANYGGGGIIEPVPMFVTYNSTTRSLQLYDPLALQLTTTGVVPVGGFAAGVPTRLGAPQVATAASSPPRGQAYYGILKYSGVLSTAQMDSIWTTFRDNHRAICNYVLIYGNSVTSGSDAAEAGLNTALNWPHVFSRTALRNNCIVLRPLSMGGKSLYFMRDTDFVKPIGSSYMGGYPAVSTGVTQDSVSYWGPRWKPTILLLDENQNTAASQSVNVTYDIDWAGTENNPGIARHVIEKLKVHTPTLKVVAGTMLAVGPDGKSYATIIAEETSIPSRWRRNLRDWSAAIRLDSAGLYDSVYDLYADFNLGWDTIDDGDAATPATDYPNGNPAYFYDDHQHPNAAGHAIMATGYWTAVDSVRL
jgi:hypothetical protein